MNRFPRARGVSFLSSVMPLSLSLVFCGEAVFYDAQRLWGIEPPLRVLSPRLFVVMSYILFCHVAFVCRVNSCTVDQAAQLGGQKDLQQPPLFRSLKLSRLFGCLRLVAIMLSWLTMSIEFCVQIIHFRLVVRPTNSDL